MYLHILSITDQGICISNWSITLVQWYSNAVGLSYVIFIRACLARNPNFVLCLSPEETELSVLCFLNPRSDVNRQALFTNVNYIVGTSACHCFVHCINDKCVFMQITYFLKIIIFSSIQHLRNDARFLLYRNPWSKINRTANLNLYHFVSFKSCEFAFKNKQNKNVSHSTKIFEIFGTLIITF